MSPPKQPKCKRALLTLATGIFLSVSTVSAQSTNWHEGMAFVTALTGSARVGSSDGAKQAIQVHTATVLQNRHLMTGPNSKLICTLSNNVSIGLLADARLDVSEFSQKPFSDETVNPEREPSVSTLEMSLQKGACVLSVDKISPLSKIRLQLPSGKFSMNRALVYIRTEAEASYIDLLSGTITYYFDGDDQRHYLTAPTSVRISKINIEAKDLNEAPSQLDPQSDTIDFAKAVSRAYNRVLFTSQAAAGFEAPVPIIKSSYYDQTSARPYGYLDKP